MEHFRHIILLLTLLPFFALAQEAQDGQGVTLIYLEQAERLSFDQQRVPNGQLLTGNVRFRHGDALMYCDSAYFFQQSNSFNAFSNVRIVQGDSIFLYGNRLNYDGNSMLARMRDSVRMENKTTTLTTDTLYYDRLNNYAYYHTGGVISDDVNTLRSMRGEYYPNSRQAVFKTDVWLENNNFTMQADTLQYNTQSHIADIVGETTIVYQGETTIRSTLGWYNTVTEHSTLYRQSKVEHDGGQTLMGDTIFYDKRNQYGRVHGHMMLTDSTNHLTLCGNYGTYDKIRGDGMATDSAMTIDWSDTDTLYMHADSMFIHQYYVAPDTLANIVSEDTLALADTLAAPNEPDSLRCNTIRAFWNVRLYRTNLQAIADSMYYDTRDSVMHLYRNPILWNEDNQITGDNADIYMADNTVHHAVLTGKGIVIQRLDSLHYNQMQGKELVAYIDHKQLTRVDVNGNAETVFYPEDNEELIGVNKTVSSYVKIYFKDKKIDRAVLTSASEGTMYPLDQIDNDELYLSQFFLSTQERPKSKQDIFAPTVRTPRATKQVVSAISNDIDEADDPKKAKNRNKDKTDKTEKAKIKKR